MGNNIYDRKKKNYENIENMKKIITEDSRVDKKNIVPAKL